MLLTDENCKIAIHLIDSDERKGMVMMMNLLNLYQTKYEIKNEEICNKDFRKDTKLIFQLFRNCIASDNMIKEMFEEYDDSEVDKIEKEEYWQFTENIKFVLQQIDTVDLLNPDDEFTSNCNNAITFLTKKDEDMKGLTNTMKKLSFTLEGLGNALSNTSNDLNLPKARL